MSTATLDLVNNSERLTVPILGSKTLERHQRICMFVLALMLLILGATTAWIVIQSDRTAKQVGAAAQSLLQSQRLAKSATQALIGNLGAFTELSESHDALNKNINALRDGNESLGVGAVSEDLQADLKSLKPSLDKNGKNVKLILDQKNFLVELSGALRGMNRRSSDLAEMAEFVSSLKLQQNAPAQEISTAGELVMLTQRDELLKLYDETRTQAVGILGNLQGMVDVRDAQNGILAESEPLRQQLDALQAKLSKQSDIEPWVLALLAIAGVFATLAAVGLVYVQVLDGRRRQSQAEMQTLAAQTQEMEAKRLNDANQAAILRLMNEMQNVADGDLTQEATVTEDITGAIADSVNYTVEALRSLVGNVHKTSSLVASTTSQVEASSNQLLAASTQQLIDIRQTGQSVLAMADRMTQASSLADESASVAKQFLTAANSGLSAVQSTMGGMSAIRNQIQETAKRMKRLDESSQEIGEMTDLISDITEQTNVLALNAAIQAASAGEAGRGFTVVAEEVQRLAERSGDATRQISNLVKAIQSDTQEVVASMEVSTRGVVSGAQLSENAGAALSEIDRISKQLTGLIERISSGTANEAREASAVAATIQNISTVTQRTSEGTEANAKMVRELSVMADDLKRSVARFKLA
ncbi:MAG: methyl-accepting chemotaxis protein [Cytophagales bacterium]|nr:methyl-accepting chemotaxis protein [Cytophagales bacterium]